MKHSWPSTFKASMFADEPTLSKVIITKKLICSEMHRYFFLDVIS